MIRAYLLVAFFLTLALDEALTIGLSITAGLSAKNAFLFVLLLSIFFQKAADRSNNEIQLKGLHLIFILLIGHVFLSIFFMHFVTGDTAGYGVFGHIGLLKSDLADMYLMLLVFFYGIDSREAAMNLAKLILLVVSLMGFLTLLDALNMPDLGLVIDGKYGRLEGPLGGANNYGVFFAFFVPILVLAAIGLGNWLLRTFYFLGAAVAFAILIQTGSRGGFAGMVGGILLAGWWLRGAYDFRKAFKGGIVALGMAVIVFIWLLISVDQVSYIIENRIERSTAGSVDDIGSGRLWIWGQGLNYLMDKPWRFIVGAGWGTFWTRIGISPHGIYMNYLFSLGVIGLGLFLALVFRVLFHIRRGCFAANINSEERLLLIGVSIGWFVLVIAMFTGTAFKVWMFTWPLTALCLRITYCLLAQERDSTPAQADSPPDSPLPNVVNPGYSRMGRLGT